MINVKFGKPSKFYLTGKEISPHKAYRMYRQGAHFGTPPPHSRPPTRVTWNDDRTERKEYKFIEKLGKEEDEPGAIEQYAIIDGEPRLRRKITQRGGEPNMITEYDSKGRKKTEQTVSGNPKKLTIHEIKKFDVDGNLLTMEELESGKTVALTTYLTKNAGHPVFLRVRREFDQDGGHIDEFSRGNAMLHRTDGAAQIIHPRVGPVQKYYWLHGNLLDSQEDIDEIKKIERKVYLRSLRPAGRAS